MGRAEAARSAQHALVSDVMLSVPGSDDRVVLLDYMDRPYVFENLLPLDAG